MEPTPRCKSEVITPVSDQTRVLVLGDDKLTDADWLRNVVKMDGVGSEPQPQLVRAHSWHEILFRLRCESFDAVVVSPHDSPLWQALQLNEQAQSILAAIPDAVAVVDFDLRVRWANPIFESWCGTCPLGLGFYEALGSPEVDGPEFCPFHTALAQFSAVSDTQERQNQLGKVTAHLVCCNHRHVELHVTPILGLQGGGPRDTLLEGGSPTQESLPLLLAVGHDITALVRHQNKLAALHNAGRELAALKPEHIAEMSVSERVELLKLNIRNLTRDLLHYEVIEIRLLNPQNNRLEPLLQEGMTAEAAHRVLFAQPEGCGVTGFVAATGQSYLCPDTQADLLYLPGAPGAHSSLTVPLIFQNRIIGTFNVESPLDDAFGEDDLRFTEIFSHEVAAALNTLELLSAEKSSATTESIDAVNREVALPVDEILTATTSILERYMGQGLEGGGGAPETLTEGASVPVDMADKLRTILDRARLIKQSIQKVGEDQVCTLWGLPLPSDQDTVSGAQPTHPHLRGLRVLVADSDERVRRSAHGLLGRWGCVVETARDGREALTMAKLCAYDAILADIRLPDVGGYEIYRGLRQTQPQARVILMTGYGYDPSHSLVHARQDGLRQVLFKPFRVDQLRDALSAPDKP